MPISGTYYYPVAQKPNSSYPAIDVRGLGDHPSTASGLGRLYMLSSSNDLYFKDPDGNEIVVASAGAGVGSNVFDNVIVSGTATVRGSVVNNAGHLILSSSTGLIMLSGTAKLTGYTFATLPAGSTTLSGSVVWVSDRNCHALYGATGWTRILTGVLV